MILFSDFSRKKEIFEAPSFPKNIHEIKPISNISEAEARNFWNNIFSKPKETSEITEQDAGAQVCGMWVRLCWNF